MIRSKAAITLYALVAVGALLGGCGGSGDSEGAPTQGDAAAGQPRGGGAEGGEAGGGPGGGGQGEGGSGAPIAGAVLVPKNEFAEQADEICEKRTPEILIRAQGYLQEQKEQGTSKNVSALLAEAVDRIFIPNVREQVKAFGELELPEGEEQEAEAFIAAMQEGVRATERNNYTAADVDELGREFRKAVPLAEALGIGNCGFGA